MCKYCGYFTEEEELAVSIWEIAAWKLVKMYIMGNVLFVEFNGFPYGLDEADISTDISFCPFCGKQLRPLFGQIPKKGCSWCKPTNNAVTGPSWGDSDRNVSLHIGQTEKHCPILCIELHGIFVDKPDMTIARPIAFCVNCGDLLI